NQTNPTVPTIPDTTVAAIVAAKSPITRLSVLSSKDEPCIRSISPAMRAPSPALATAKKREHQTLRSPSRLAEMVAAITPRMTGQRAAEPATIRAPDATPAAGQNTATPSGLERRARLSRAARKYAIATATVVAAEAAHAGRRVSALAAIAKV